MPDNAAIRKRIEAAEAELAEAREELERIDAQPKYEPDSLYLIQEPRWAYIAYGRDMGTNEQGRLCVSRFLTVGQPNKGRIKADSYASVEPYSGRATAFDINTTVVRLHKGDF